MVARESFRPTALTFPIVAVGVVLGLVVCTANMYFGLQIGTLSTMPSPMALLSFAIFKGLSNRLQQNFSPTENVVVQAISSSMAGMPVAASLLSVIPALEFFSRSDEGSNRRFTIPELMIWSFGVCLFGIVWSSSFRTYFIRRLRLRFPGGYATGVLVGLLHGDTETANNARFHTRNEDELSITDETFEPSELEETNSQDGLKWPSSISLMMKAFCGTAVWVVISYFIPGLRVVPIFGTRAARDFLWGLDSSPALISFGLVIDLSIASSMLLGAVAGWGVLSPLAKRRGWAPGPPNDLETGVRGWLTWVSMALLLGDNIVTIGHGTISLGVKFYQTAVAVRSAQNAGRINSEDDAATSQPLLGETISDAGNATVEEGGQVGLGQSSQLPPTKTIIFWAIASTALCVGCTHFVFHQLIPVYATILAVALTLPLCLVVIQTTGDTDTIPSNSLSNACQFLFSLVIRAPGAGVVTMILGAITEAGLWQSAVLMTDLKTASLVRASPRVILYAQVIGSVAGAFLGATVYRIFTLAYKVPSDRFPVPLALLWINMARLVTEKDLPPGLGVISVFAFVLAAGLRVFRIALRNKGWGRWIPSGTAVSIGFLIPPPIILARCLGSALHQFCTQNLKVPEMSLMSAATGCILSEGILWVFPLIMETLNVHPV